MEKTGTNNENRRDGAPDEVWQPDNPVATLLDRSCDGYVVTDRNDCVVELNETAASMLGAERAAALGRRFRHLIGEEAQDCHTELTERLSDGADHAQGTMRLPDQGGSAVVRVVARDPERRRWLVQRLPTGEELADDAVGVAFASLTTHSITECDEVFVRLMGVGEKELEGRSLSMLFERQDRTREGTFVDPLVSGQRCTVQRECLLRRPFADPLWARLTITKIAEDRLCIHLEDIGRDKRMQDELRRAQKAEVMGRLASGIAHDFNNLLMSLMGGIGVASSKLDPGSPAAEHLTEVKRVIMRGAELVGQLLSFGGKGDAPGLDVDVDEVIRRTERVLRPLLSEDVELRLKLRAPGTHARCSAAQIEQILVNLAVNARDAMPEGGRIEITTEIQHVNGEGYAVFPETPGGQYVVLAVRDTGTGMDPSVKQRAFDPYFTTKDHDRGTGLGLSNVRGIVGRAGGFIRLDTTPGSGSSFRIWLPLANERKGDERVDSGAALPRRGKETVLVVEDEPSVRLALTHQLSTWGYDVLEAADSHAAKEVMANRDVDLLITDIVLPGMQGPQLADMLREQRPDLRVIYMSAYSIDQLKDDGRLASNHLALQKPFEERCLADMLREAFSG